MRGREGSEAGGEGKGRRVPWRASGVSHHRSGAIIQALAMHRDPTTPPLYPLATLTASPAVTRARAPHVNA